MAVELYSATRTGARISFRQIHEPSGKRIRYEKVVPGIGPVEKDEIMKGQERPATGDNVIDLMAALKKSLEKTSGGGSKAGKKTSSTKTSKKKKATSRNRKRA